MIIKKNALTDSITFTMMENGQPVERTKDILSLTPGERAFILSKFERKS